MGSTLTFLKISAQKKKGKARLEDGAISVLWENGTTLRYYCTLDGGTRYLFFYFFYFCVISKSK
jgi:hypothetical protein